MRMAEHPGEAALKAEARHTKKVVFVSRSDSTVVSHGRALSRHEPRANGVSVGAYPSPPRCELNPPVDATPTGIPSNVHSENIAGRTGRSGAFCRNVSACWLLSPFTRRRRQ